MFKKLTIFLSGFEVKFSTNISKVSKVFPYESMSRLLKVAVIGMPNAGKSTFINNLMDRKVCPTSCKVHTTRSKCKAIFTEADSQIVFLDTPGLVNLREQKKYNLEKTFLRDSKSSLHDADIIGVIHDVSNVWTCDKLDIKVIKLLKDHQYKPSFLVLNKVDIIRSKRKLLDLTRIITENCLDSKPILGSKRLQCGYSNIKGWPHFREIFMVSALNGSGLTEVKNYLIQNAKSAKWLFPADVWSDQTAEEIILKSVKAKLLDFIPQEIPYSLKPEIEFFEVNERGIISTVVVVHCPSERVAKLVAGVSDGKLRQITESLQHDLQETFQNYVRVKLILQGLKQ